MATNASTFLSEFQKTLEVNKYPTKQVVVMDVTAGIYIVATPPNTDLPRIVSSIDQESVLKIEFNHSLKSKTVSQILELISNRFKFPLISWELIDSQSGILLAGEHFNQTESSVKFQSSDLSILIKKHKQADKFNISYNVISSDQSDIKDIFEGIHEDDKKILEFIRKQPTRSIQSRHLNKIFPKLSKEQRKIKLRTLEKSGYLLRGGSWYMENTHR
ncbi:MAG: hypothetical protein ACXAC7_03000 [Candidatus Hodarchaeales archaeon]